MTHEGFRTWRVYADFDYPAEIDMEAALQKALEEIEPGREIEWAIAPVVKELENLQ